ncbi:MAG TPA: SLC13 family permease, partial [Dehalococcoidia bacterium]|nr:SLC13 family permease [Dehalococcoidia bacterium]
HLHAGPELRRRILELDESQAITDPRLLRISLAVLGLTIMGFLFHGPLGYEPASVALAGATAILVLGRQDIHEALRHVEWNTIFFFVGLFMVVGGVEEVGILEDIGQGMADAAGGSSLAASGLILGLSGLASGIVDNIPYTAAMIPVVEEMGRQVPGAGNTLWWALSLGACLGGNLTIIAAAANVLVVNLAERAGYRITFGQFLRHGALVTAISLAIAMLYLWLRYLL